MKLRTLKILAAIGVIAIGATVLFPLFFMMGYLVEPYVMFMGQEILSYIFAVAFSLCTVGTAMGLKAVVRA